MNFVISSQMEPRPEMLFLFFFFFFLRDAVFGFSKRFWGINAPESYEPSDLFILYGPSMITSLW